MTNQELCQEIESLSIREVRLHKENTLLPALRIARDNFKASRLEYKNALRDLKPVNARLATVEGAKIVRGVAVRLEHSHWTGGAYFFFNSLGTDMRRAASGEFGKGSIRWKVWWSVDNGKRQEVYANSQDQAELIALDWVCEGKSPKEMEIV